MDNKTNIVMILIDDMGWKDLACYGSEFYETPNIDALAKEGMMFTDAYAACPVCSPTRASIMSGKYPATVGVTDWIDHSGAIHPCKGRLIDVPYIKHLPLEEKSIAKALQENDYQTWHVGKWHLGDTKYHPEKHGFDVNIAGSKRGAPAKGGYFSPYGMENLEDGEEGEYLLDRLTDEAIQLINNRSENPFFLYLSHYAVHEPIEAKEKDIEYFKQKAIDMGLDDSKALEVGEYFPQERKKNQRLVRRKFQSNAVYAAMIYNLDQNVGRLMETLKNEGIDENTVVVFFSDNGGLSTTEGSPTCNYPLSEGKGWVYEGGVREPLIVRWPGQIEAGSICHEPVTSTDFYPTFLDMAQLELMPEQHVDGVSILDLLTQKGSINRDALYWHYPHYGNQGGTPASSIRCGDYKLIEFYESGKLELYNLREDIKEERNLADSEQEICKTLHNKLLNWKTSIEAKIPQRNLEYKEMNYETEVNK